MKERKIKSKKVSSSGFIPMYAVIILLLVGIIFAFMQLDKSQTMESRAQTLTNCDVDSVASTAEEQALFNSMNTFRQEQSLTPLMYSEALSRPAQWYADDITRGNNGQGMDSAGRATERRISDCGVMLSMMGEFGESVLIAPSEAEAMMVLRMNAVATGNTRDDNVIYAPFTHVGIGKNGQNWVVVFAHGINAPMVTQVPTPTFGSIFVPTVEPTDPPMITEAPAENPTPTPCVENQFQADDETITANHNKQNSKHRQKKKLSDNFDGLLKQILQLLEQLLAILGGGTPPTQEPSDPGTEPDPTTEPDPGTEPDPTSEPEPTTAPDPGNGEEPTDTPNPCPQQN